MATVCSRIEGEKPFVCSDCGAAFISKIKLSEHRMRNHLAPHERRRYLCEECSKTYANRADLIKHAR